MSRKIRALKSFPSSGMVNCCFAEWRRRWAWDRALYLLSGDFYLSIWYTIITGHSKQSTQQIWINWFTNPNKHFKSVINQVNAMTFQLFAAQIQQGREDNDSIFIRVANLLLLFMRGMGGREFQMCWWTVFRKMLFTCGFRLCSAQKRGWICAMLDSGGDTKKLDSRYDLKSEGIKFDWRKAI